MSPAPNMGFGDTTYTKVFVGGLAWETQRENMMKYFEQFGEILEAVVITDKNTGRSKGYGFVTFREPESAMKACMDPAPVIDGRRANCNLACLGVKGSRPTTPQHGGGRSFRVVKGFHAGLQGGIGAAFSTPSTFPHYAIQQQGVPYNVYGYPAFSPEYTYPASYFNPYGGAAGQYPYGATAFYPCYQFNHNGGTYNNQGGQGYGVQYPQMAQYSAMTPATGLTGLGHHYGVPLSLSPSSLAQPGMIMSLKPSLASSTTPQLKHNPAQCTSSALEQP